MDGSRTLAEPPPDASPARWQHLLAQAVRDPAELLRLLDLPADLLPPAAATRGFPLLVPRGFVARMERGNPDDPLLRQVLPIAAETAAVAGFTADPLAEHAADACGRAGSGAVPGLLHKYRNRVLLVTTAACAVHCRYCFRRHFDYRSLPTGPAWWTPALAAIAADPLIDEVILSGGDPLTLPDAQLAALAADLRALPRIRRLRLHTRLPVVLPERIDPALLAWLCQPGPTPVVVIHANHPAEISTEVATACRRLRDAGVLVLNQSVLLAGVNDHAQTLAALSLRLFDAGVLPYYLHVLDRVAGAAHFLVDDSRARALHRELAALLPGYLLPRLVREVAGEASKRTLA